MKIVKKKEAPTTFAELQVGDTFEIPEIGFVLAKVFIEATSKTAAMSFVTGKIIDMSDDQEVMKVRTTITVYY